MAKSNAKLKPVDQEPVTDPAILLQALAEATANPSGYLFTSPAEHGPLLAAGLAMVNKDIAEGGKLATRLTPEGVQKAAAAAQPASGGFSGAQTVAQPSTPNQKRVFSGLVSVPMPEHIGRKGMTRPEIYPFATMEVNQAFFVAASEKDPHPERTFASTVSSARNRYARELPGQTRVNRKGTTVPVVEYERDFKIALVPDGVIFGEQFKGQKGAGIWRVK